ncbi:hypothetical protein [Kitasatospora sp. NPDC059327]|uniref:hypothetical protein n=1 Tax=Kitasatospora sp. NPDC059327 TaxID=3346803 RepID=UPI0036B5320A
MVRTVIAEAAAVTVLTLAVLVPAAAAHAAPDRPTAAVAAAQDTTQAATAPGAVADRPGTPVQADNMIWG